MTAMEAAVMTDMAVADLSHGRAAETTGRVEAKVAAATSKNDLAPAAVRKLKAKGSVDKPTTHHVFFDIEMSDSDVFAPFLKPNAPLPADVKGAFWHQGLYLVK